MGRFLRFEPAFWVAVVAASYGYDLYYTVTSLIIFATRLHWVLWPWARFPPFPYFILVLLLICCFFLSPFHVFTYTPMDLWAPYSIRAPLNLVEIVHDPGENTVVEFEDTID